MADKNLSLTGTPSFTLTESQSIQTIYSTAVNMKDDDTGTKVGFFAFRDRTGHFVGGTYEAIIEFDRVAPIINKIEFYRYWQLLEGLSQTGYEKTYLYYNSQWNLIDTQTYVSLGSGTGTITITSGAPWNDVTKVKVVSRMYLYSSSSADTIAAHYLYELRAWGAAHKDIGLRLYTGSSAIKIGCQDLLSSHKLRIRKDGTTYGIELVAVNDIQASGIRIYDGAAIKALPLVD